MIAMSNYKESNVLRAFFDTFKDAKEFVAEIGVLDIPNQLTLFDYSTGH